MSSQTALAIRLHIENNELTSAQLLLDQGAAKLGLSSFDYNYLKAKAWIYQGDYLLASQVLKTLAASLNLEVLADLTLCYYQLGLAPEFAESLELLTVEYLKQQKEVPLKQSFDVAILIAKFYEEVGAPERSFTVLNGILAEDVYASKVVLIQKLRLAVLLERVEEAGELYRMIVSGTRHNQNFEIEREHALLLADNFLLGYEAMLDRYKYLLTLQISDENKTFLYCEVAEALILAGQSELIQSMKVPSGINSDYEIYFLQLIRKFIFSENIEEPNISQYEKRLSPVSVVRMLRVYIALTPQTQLVADRRFQMALNRLPSKTLKAILGRRSNKKVEGRLILDFKNKKIEYGGRVTQIKGKLFWGLLKAFVDRQQVGCQVIALGELVKLVYEEVESPQHYDRIRMSIYRFNKEAALNLGCADLFKITKSGVECTLPLEIRND